jgi:hypothetical protein
VKARPSGSPRPGGGPGGPGGRGGPERRVNRPLREVLDELLSHTREIARRAKTMSPAELDYAQQRLEWLADEVWRLSTGEATLPE